MDFSFSPEQEKLRKDVRDFIAEQRQLQKERGVKRGIFPQEFFQAVGAKGYCGAAIPKELGGYGGSHMDLAIVLEEFQGWAPEPIFTAVYSNNLAAAALYKFGNEYIKRTFIPKLMSGDIKVCGGFTEPDVGSHTAGIKCRAIKDGNEYVLNGTKLYNDAHEYQYAIATAVTDPSAPEGEGITWFLVDLSSPGVTISPIWTFWGYRRNEINFEDVKTPEENMVGELNRAWHYTDGFYQLEDWILFGNAGQMQRSFDMLLDYVRQTKYAGKLLSECPGIRQRLAELAMELYLSRLLFYRACWMRDRESPVAAAAAMAKLYTTELCQRLYEAMIDIAGKVGQIDRAAGSRAPMRGLPAIFYRFATSQTIASWTTEMQRNRIAKSALSLP
jgi:alkylation response protein AidB-like acyl-CoA dehydrogenase